LFDQEFAHRCQLSHVYQGGSEAFPFPESDQLSGSQKRRILSLAAQLQGSESKPWVAIDDFIFGLYGLDEHDATVVRDTVAFSGPYRSIRGPQSRNQNPRNSKRFVAI